MRVDLLLADRRSYTYTAHAARHVSKYFERIPISHQLIYLNDGALRDYLFYIQHSPPKWTLSFTSLTFHQQPLCDMIRIPHCFWLEGSFAQAIHLLGSSYGKVGIENQAFCQKLAAANVFFLPPGVEKNVHHDQETFDVVLFADLLDFSFLEKTWRELFSFEEIKSIKKAIQCADPFVAKPYFFYVEQYLNAQKTYHTVTRFKDVKLDLFGGHAGNNWLLRLTPNIHLHAPLPFSEFFEVLKASKIALVEPASQWYLPAIAAGCLPLSPDEETVKYYLSHPDERQKTLEKLQHKVLEQSWEKQIKLLLEYMDENQCDYADGR
jgi:hypothetical protein